MINKVLVLADSLALPRHEHDDIVLYEETWPFLLQKHYPNIHVINWGRRSRTSLTTLSEFNEIDLVNADMIILQVGVVDGAPRIFTHFEKSILKRLPSGIRNRIISFRKKRRNKITGRNPLKKVDVKPDKFEEYLSLFIEKAKSRNPRTIITLIPIIANYEVMESKSKGFTQNIELYNSIIEKVAKETKALLTNIEPFIQRKNQLLFCSDGYHINAKGNQELYKSISQYINFKND